MVSTTRRLCRTALRLPQPSRTAKFGFATSTDKGTSRASIRSKAISPRAASPSASGKNAKPFDARRNKEQGSIDKQAKRAIKSRKVKLPRPSGRFIKKVWVPPAYRPPLESFEPSFDDRNAKAAATVTEEESQKAEQRLRRERQRKEYDERLAKLLSDVTVQVSRYRSYFQESSLESTSTTTSSNLLDIQNGSELLRDIKTLVSNMHESDVLVNRQKLQQSFPSYGELCRTLQHICSVACNICSMAHVVDPSGERPASSSASAVTLYVDLAEVVLLELIRLSQDRMLLIETANQWNKTPAVVKPPENRSRRNSAVSGWLSNVVQKVLAPFSDTEKQTPDVPYSSSAEHNINQATQQLIRNVMRHVSGSNPSSSVAVRTQQAQALDSDTTQSSTTATSKRLFALLDSIPPKWSVNCVVLLDVMEILAPLGTLESARKCKLLFERQQPLDDAALPFSHVLAAYLATIQKEPSPVQQMAIVEEVCEVLGHYWNGSKAAGVYSKRASHCAIVLQCMTKVKWLDTPGLCDKAEALVEKALGSSMYSDVKSQLGGEQPDIPTQVMPLLNYLAAIFASSGEPSRILEAWKILDAITKQCHSSGLKVHPDAATANQVLFALADIYTPKHASHASVTEARKSQIEVIDFATNLVEYMHSRGDRSTWPTRSTYQALFQIIDRTNTPDAAERTQRLLFQYEARRRALQDSMKGDKERRLTFHHCTLRKWAEAANDRRGSTDDHSIPCVEAGRLVEKLVIQSSPFLYPELAIEKLVPFLYEVALRPRDQTYLLFLKVCARTSDPKHWEIAATTAQRVAEKSRVRLDERHVALLEACSAKLPTESTSKQKLDGLIAFLSVEPENGDTNVDVDEDHFDVTNRTEEIGDDPPVSEKTMSAAK